MKLLARTEYACLAMIELARANGAVCPLRDIAAKAGMSKGFLQEVVGQLAVAGYVTSVCGRRGGYMLACAPSKTTLLDVIDCMEGAELGTYEPHCVYQRPSLTLLGEIVCDATRAQRAKLSRLTLQQIVNRLSVR